MPKIILEPGSYELNAPRKANLLKFLHGAEIPVGSACGGKGLCASCKLTILEGAKNLSHPNTRELELAERNHLQKDERIACQCKILGDIRITTNYWMEEDFEK